MFRKILTATTFHCIGEMGEGKEIKLYVAKNGNKFHQSTLWQYITHQKNVIKAGFQVKNTIKEGRKDQSWQIRGENIAIKESFKTP